MKINISTASLILSIGSLFLSYKCVQSIYSDSASTGDNKAILFDAQKKVKLFTSEKKVYVANSDRKISEIEHDLNAEKEKAFLSNQIIDENNKRFYFLSILLILFIFSGLLFFTIFKNRAEGSCEYYYRYNR
jgi:hypothetical protein